MKVVEGCDAIVHFGAAPVERPWEEILESSIKGGYNVYEAARRHGVRRIVYASSIHAVGYERREVGADTDTPHNPGYAVRRVQVLRRRPGQVVLQQVGYRVGVVYSINSCFPKPADRRHLATWLSVRRPEPAGRALPGVGAHRPHRGLRYLRTTAKLFSPTTRSRISVTGRRTVPRTTAPRSRRRPSPGDPLRPGDRVRRRGFLCAYGHPDESERHGVSDSGACSVIPAGAPSLPVRRAARILSGGCCRCT